MAGELLADEVERSWIEYFMCPMEQYQHSNRNTENQFTEVIIVKRIAHYHVSGDFDPYGQQQRMFGMA